MANICGWMSGWVKRHNTGESSNLSTFFSCKLDFHLGCKLLSLQLLNSSLASGRLRSWWNGGCEYLSNGDGWSRCHGDGECRQLRVDSVGIRIIHRCSKPPLPNQPYRSAVRGLPHGYEGPSWIKSQLQVLIFCYAIRPSFIHLNHHTQGT